jgi:sulfate adenylyltransferase
MAAYREALQMEPTFPGFNLGHVREFPTLLVPLPLAMRMAGPREAVHHAIIRKNMGATHFVVGRDHAGPSTKRSFPDGGAKAGEPFYDPSAALELIQSLKSELGIDPVTFSAIGYDGRKGAYGLLTDIPEEDRKVISGTHVRWALQNGEPLPEWFTKPEVYKILSDWYGRPRGCVIYCVGLSASGKTTLALAVKERLEGKADCPPITFLDGDEVRANLSKGLSFSREDRGINVTRIGYVACVAARSGGIAICANIAPYAEDRDANRKRAASMGLRYLEVFVDTPLAVCEERDPKGLYAGARAGRIKGFTGISDPWEPPTAPDLRIDGTAPISDNVYRVVNALEIL